ncbi:hypothetical protein M947_04505 [Sulfurimonas hongkongensis]|uniref:Uncharacterized protein n=1 Tax=Sulfurimonas hongkongensis TaxID=1172190 RepID=T0KS67_9BACT|nr:hypothetical protein [Sulfurimonas hongkongensis]EQB39844.1 hypothetical protein M947_04505 [Sulfurimonas hongkongensis]
MYSDNFYKSFINESINPFILFNNEGKLLDFNYEAEILFNSISPKEIFELTLKHSPYNFGFERKYIHLKYAKMKYYAILIGYLDDEHIAIELYKQVDIEKEVAKIEDVQQTNIFSLIDIAKNTNFDFTKTTITGEYDTSIPEIKVNINNFLLTLNECFKLFIESKQVKISVHVKVGEYEVIDAKRYSIAYIKCKANTPIEASHNLERQALKSHINVFEINGYIKLEFPMIL